MSSAGLNLPLWPRAGYILTDGNGWKPFSNDRAATGTKSKGRRKYAVSQDQHHFSAQEGLWIIQGVY